jgi:protein-tyrosine phosphatase
MKSKIPAQTEIYMPPALLSAQEMPCISGLDTPRDFYVPTLSPAPLAGMPYPKPSTPWQDFFRLGFRHIVRLETEKPAYDPFPLNLLYTAALEDLIHARPPRDPQAQESLIREVVSTILGVLEGGEGVIAHCVGGTGRTGTALGCTLVALGYSAPEVIAYLDQLNKTRGKSGWPESAWQSELLSSFSAGRFS